MKNVAWILGTAALLAGCGGGSSNSPTPANKGTASMTINWPDRTTRLIPTTANSITVNLSLNGTVVATQTVARPSSGNSSVLTFTDLPFGSLGVSATAYPEANGSGNAQAVGSGTLNEVMGTAGAISISLSSTVTKLAITPNPIASGKGLTLTLTASATDAKGNIVLLSVGSASEPLTWTTDDASVATVSGNGATAVLTGVEKGTTNVHASFVTDDGGDQVTTSSSVPVTAATGTVTIK